MLTLYVKDYGPIRPDQSLPIPKAVLVALLALGNIKLGSMQYNRTTKHSLHYHAMLNLGLNLEFGCGVRLRAHISSSALHSAPRWHSSGAPLGPV